MELPEGGFIMVTEIYYFSGTGNSLVVARDIARQLDGKLISIAAMPQTQTINSDADVIGIIFPIHNAVNGGVPSIVRSFLAKMENVTSTYIFAVCTCGAGSGDALINIQKLIKAKGGKLAAGFTIKMPFNCPPFTQSEEQQKRFRDWNRRLDDICEKVKDQKESKITTMNPLIRALVYPLGLLMHYLILKNYRKLSKDPNANFDDTVRLLDQSYYVDENCNGCGICAKVCRVGNIEIIDNKPVWQHHCESCLSCFVWCPQKAVFGGILSGKSERYHHPDVKLRDMLL